MVRFDASRPVNVRSCARSLVGVRLSAVEVHVLDVGVEQDTTRRDLELEVLMEVHVAAREGEKEFDGVHSGFGVTAKEENGLRVRIR